MGIRNNLDKLLVNTADNFDHIKIQRLQVHSDCASLRRHHTKIIQEAYVEYRDEGKDVKEEESLVLKDEIYRQEVMDKLFESLQLIEDYEESCHISRIWYRGCRQEPGDI
jgi:hypothetical protein